MAESDQKPRSATAGKITDSQVKQLKASLKESANKYDELLVHLSEFQKQEDRKRRGEIEEVINSHLKETLELCRKLEKEIEVMEHKNRQGVKSADGSKKNVSAFAADFRLTPEEQDIAYEFKAHVMRKIHSQNQNIKKELEMHEKKVDLKKCQQAFKKQVDEKNKSQSTVVKLADAFEKRALKAEARLRRLTDQLRQADDVIARYDEMYYKQGGDPNRMRQPASKDAHQRPDDIIRRNEALTRENERLRKDVVDLKKDNNDLIKFVKMAESERDETMHNLGTCDMARQELMKRFAKEQQQHRLLKASITKQTSNWVQERKSMRRMDDKDRQDQLNPVSPFGAKERLLQYPVKKNVDKPRQTTVY